MLKQPTTSDCRDICAAMYRTSAFADVRLYSLHRPLCWIKQPSDASTNSAAPEALEPNYRIVRPQCFRSLHQAFGQVVGFGKRA